MSFNDFLGIELLETNEHFAKARILLKDEYKNNINSLHGGMTATIADTISGYLASNRKYMTPTNNMSLYYLRPIMFEEGDYCYAEARIIKRGKKIVVINTEIYDNDYNLCAYSTFSFSVVERPKEYDYQSYVVFKNEEK